MEKNRLVAAISEDRILALSPSMHHETVQLPPPRVHSATGENAARWVGGVLLKVCAVAVVAFSVRHQFSMLNMTTVLALLERVGWRSGLILLPALFATFADTVGWASCLTQHSMRRLVPRLLQARIGCDALCNSIPGGVTLGETLRPLWLRELCAINMTESVTSCLLAKLNMAIAQLLYICVTLIFLGVAGEIGNGLPLKSDGVWSTVVVGLLLLTILAGLSLAYTGSCFTRGLAFVTQFPWVRIKRRLVALTPFVAQIDACIRDFRNQHFRRLIQSLAAFFVGWILAGFESFAILTLLDVPTSIGMALSLDALASVSRIVFFFIPSALGVTEIGYATLISAFGIPDPITVSATFAVLKRSREAVWILLGYIALIRHRWTVRKGCKANGDLSSVPS